MIKIGMVGVGDISGIYLKNFKKKFHNMKLIAVCDLIREKAEKAKEIYDIPKIYDTMHEMFADKEIDIILNLTRPYEHFEVSKAALLAGKHVYSEKPLAASYEEGLKLVELAKEKKLMLGGAPDTFLGSGIQTCKKLIEDDFIGQPIGAAAFMICRGHESWHPDPEFYYKYGGGPMMDMGPYYITALINLLGGIKSVTGIARTPFKQRTITSTPKKGQIIDVDVSTYVSGLMEFESGAIGTLFTTFDVYYPGQARFEIYGSKGTLFVPDPNTFSGPIKLLRPEDGEIKEMPLLFDYSDNSRGLGLMDMVTAIETATPFRASYNQTLHVLEVMNAFQKSSEAKSAIQIKNKFTLFPPR
ncbi:Gfo/Idh/MocA family protein [Clostridium sp. Marseille-P299]|uniref:Gfo/Idh/MocA family protein n=1 Tax=Clostridium sp. Marseille-P299 TaxID=1805477 RepID=UPI0008348795|nr:Gfo/Idh/MocA family oxidoreductase [Clostridium sp. Marseille-P299]